MHEELVGIIDIADGVAARVTAAKDPSVGAGIAFEVYPMPSAIIRK